ncbi:MAG TPA: glutamine synthetase family protein [Solirubrobacteraceae bacterium]|nr:glutamine synthetase family protein [Solirubrobacteraceae bacterium]
MPPSEVVDLLGTGPGRAGFIERHALWDDAEYAAAAQALRVIDEHGIELVRVAFPDQHGVLRGKALTREAFGGALRDGVTAPSTLVLKDTAGRTVYPVFESGGGPAGMAGASDIVLVPLPSTFRILPWAPRTAWVLCDIQLPDGAPVPFSSRHLLRRHLSDLAERGLDLLVGIELEFHVLRAAGEELDPQRLGQPGQPGEAPGAVPLTPGYQLLSEAALDSVDELVQALRDGLVALGLPLRSIEAEFGPSQLEVTFGPQAPLRAADDVVLCRSAIKQLCSRHGCHATFMSRPHMPNLASSGWHLHQCLLGRDEGDNRFMAPDEPLSALGRGYLAGLLAHARAASVFTTPTVNGYKRYKPYTLAPDRIVWGEDNKGAMVRTIGGPGDPATRLENRSGEPAANPYLYIASQLVSGLDGIDSGLDPGRPTDRPYGADADRLPTSLMDAIAALRADRAFAERFGAEYVEYVLTLKEAEAQRYLAAVTDWEQREYFSLY